MFYFSSIASYKHYNYKLYKKIFLQTYQQTTLPSYMRDIHKNERKKIDEFRSLKNIYKYKRNKWIAGKNCNHNYGILYTK